jgi:hypothetical protein
VYSNGEAGSRHFIRASPKQQLPEDVIEHIHNALVDRALDLGSRPIGFVREKAVELGDVTPGSYLGLDLGSRNHVRSG